MSNRVVTFGEVMLRVIPPDLQTFRQSLPGSAMLRFGGAEANVAASVAVLGGSSVFVSALPRHSIADACLAQLRGLGVDVGHVSRTDFGRMGIYFVETGANQRPSTVVYDRDGSSLSLAPPDHFPWREILRPGDWLHVSGITPALSENAAFATRRAVETAKSVGCSVSLDMNFRAKLWRWKPGVSAKELARDTISGLLQSVDLLIGNEEDAESVVGIRAEETEVETGQIHHERYASVAAEIVKRHPNVQQVAFTLRGSVSASHNTWSGMLFQDGETYFAPMIDGQLRPYEITHIVDRVGAGDSFVAGLLFSLMQGRHPQDAIAFATAASCLKHSIPGDYNMSSVADVEALLSGSGSGRVIR